MGNLNFSLQNILDGQGIEIAITGMSVVFVALALLCSFIALLPTILRIVAVIYPPNDATPPVAARDVTTAKHETLAAIGFVLHNEMGKYIPDR